MARTLLTVTQTAEILNTTYARTADLVRQRIIPSVRLGRQIRIDPVQLDSFIANGGRALPGGWRKTAA